MTTTPDTPSAPISAPVPPAVEVTADELAAICAAREALRAICHRALYHSPSTRTAGIVYEAAFSAAGDLFDFLNAANSWGGVPMTKVQLHGPDANGGDDAA